MAELLEEYLTPSNDALHINFLRTPKSPGAAKPEPVSDDFHPAFTYPIFGEEETIFGYKNLSLRLEFASHDLRPQLKVNFTEKYTPIGETKAMDIEDMMKDFIPESAWDKNLDTQLHNDKNTRTWRPPGALLKSYTHDGKKYDIWSAPLSDQRAKRMLQNIQVFAPLFIEGGTEQKLDEDDWTVERWKVFFLYEVEPESQNPARSPYLLAGYSTSWRLWAFPTPSILSRLGRDPTTHSTLKPLLTPPESEDTPPFEPEPFDPIESPSRERISQFVVLPPHQGQGHGPRLYDAMVESFLADKQVFEITVEDPNEAFDDMRDWRDMARLVREPDFRNLQLPCTLPPESLRKSEPIPTHLMVDKEKLEKIRWKYKIIPRQFARLVEIYTLHTIPPRHRSTSRITRKEKAGDPNDRRYYFWRLLVKDRLYIRNLDQLAQMDEYERKEKLDETLSSVEMEYTRLLEGAEKREIFADVSDGNGEASGSVQQTSPSKLVVSGKRKKRVVSEEESEDDSSDEEAGGRKRSRLGD